MREYNLQRFIEAQESDYVFAMSEIKKGRKRGRLMWYIRSCMTMFDYLSSNDVFWQVFDTFYSGKRGGRTLKVLNGM